MGSKTRKRSTKGGKYVGEGSYGCGYAPAIRCNDQAVRPPGMFSKVMNKEDAEEEEQIGKWFKDVDPAQKYFIYPTKSCPVHAGMLDPVENNLKPCKKGFYTTTGYKDVRMLQYINGGQELRKLILTPDDYIPFFKSIPQLLEGLILLHSKNIAHMDIKTENIVYLKEPRRYNIRYIDFGLSVNIEDMKTNPIDDSVYKKNYFAWPYDTRFMVTGFTKNIITKKSVDVFIDKHQFSMFPMPFEVYYYQDGITPHVTQANYKQIWDELKPAIGRDKLVWKEHISKSTDVYSLARAISEVYTKYVGHFYRYGVTTVFNGGRSSKINLKLIQPLVTPDVWKWHKAVSEEITAPLNTLILKMMNINPLQRISAADALDEYTLLLEKFQTYFKPELISKALDLSEKRVTPMYAATAATRGPGLGAGAGTGPIVPVTAPLLPVTAPLVPVTAPLVPVTAPLVHLPLPRINEDPFPMEKLVRMRALEKKQNRGEQLTNAEEAELEIAKILINSWEDTYNTNQSGGKRRTRKHKVRRS